MATVSVVVIASVRPLTIISAAVVAARIVVRIFLVVLPLLVITIPAIVTRAAAGPNQEGEWERNAESNLSLSKGAESNGQEGNQKHFFHFY